MLAEPITITYNAVAKSLSRINQDAYGSTYYLDDTANLMRFTLSVKHVIPKNGSPGESHLIRLDVEHISAADGTVTRKVSSWNVMKTDISSQDLVASQRCQAALLTLTTLTAQTDKVLGRQS